METRRYVTTGYECTKEEKGGKCMKDCTKNKACIVLGHQTTFRTKDSTSMSCLSALTENIGTILSSWTDIQ